MASFREHLGFSGLLGLGYGLGATFVFDFSPSQATLAGYLAGVGGMLPDLDQPNGRPGREIFSLTAALVPLVMIGHVLSWTGLPAQTENVMLLLLAMYFAVRHGLAWFVSRVSIHRGMFHSFPALGVAAEATYLAYPSELTTVKILMGGGVALGFFSHLLLDELYAIEWHGMIPKFKKSFGTALKFIGRDFGPTAFAYGLFATTTFLMLQDAGLIETVNSAPEQPVAEEAVDDAPIAPVSDEFFPNPQSIPSVQEAVLPRENLPDAPLYR